MDNSSPIYTEFLPISRADMEARGWDQLDFVVVGGDAYVDHPSFGTAIISRLLEAEGYKVGVLAQPRYSDCEDFKRFGRPKYGFFIGGGNVDSMVSHYSVAKIPRAEDEYSPGGIGGARPDRSATVYTRLAKEAYPDLPVILGGLEASLRRFAHYDYWLDTVLPSIAEDSGADLISFGMGEHQTVEIARRLAAGEPVESITDVDSAAGGGGLISLPAYLFAGLPVHYTYGTNKFSAACGTTFATAQFFQKGAMNIRVGLLAAVGSFVGSALGSHIVLLLSDQVLRTMMLIILPVAAVLILWRRDLPDENRDDGTLNAKKAVLALAIGLGIGLYDGIFGPGTGTFAIIAFTTLMGFDLRTAGGNAKVLNLASNYASLVTYLSSGLVVFSIGIPCAISGIVGNLLGSHFALKNGAKFIRPMMLVVLVLLLGKIVSDAVL